MSRERGAWMIRAGLLALVLAVAGCGSTRAATGPASSHSPSDVTAPALATSLAVPGGASWAVVQMGGSAAVHDNFWELFVRPSGAVAWKLATPAGVASNGGLVVTASGPGSLLTGFRPSQDLTFSPLATTTDAGAHWSQSNVLDAGLADLPGALASGPGGRLLAVTDTGNVETGTRGGASWARLTTQQALARTGAGRDCGLTALTAAAWTATGQPLLAGDCRTAGMAGIFTRHAGSWQAAGPSLPAALAREPVSVIGLNAVGLNTGGLNTGGPNTGGPNTGGPNTGGQRITAVLAVRAGRTAAVLAAWSADNGSTWTMSPQLSTGPASAGPRSISFGSDGSASLLLPTSHAVSSGAVIGWQAASWQSLPRLPAGTATLAATAAGQPEALAVSAGTLTVWQLATAAASKWTLAQNAHVTIPYGSSG